MRSGRLSSALFAALILAAPAPCPADEIDELKERLSAVEERLSSLEKSLEPLIAKAKAEQLQAAQQLLARERMRQDAENYSQAQLREIESLYQVANKQWGSEAAQKSLQTLVEKYDKANRTGCAILYLGQMSDGEQQAEYLNKAIEQFGDCFYGDGVQVGAYARFLLAHAYLDANLPDEAKKLFDEIRENYPDAIDHRGNSLVAKLPR